jgi:hypothetical protein
VKGAARNFGAVGMANLAEELERSTAGAGRDAALVFEELCREFEIVRELLEPMLLPVQVPAAQTLG